MEREREREREGKGKGKGAAFLCAKELKTRAGVFGHLEQNCPETIRRRSALYYGYSSYREGIRNPRAFLNS